MHINQHQPMLFPDMEINESYSKQINYQIRNMEDPTFHLTINVAENEDPETTALEQLGYFVLPETTIN